MSHEGKRDLTLLSGQHALQGHRPTMEDESIILENFVVERHGTLSFYGVFDGHGGTMAAKFVKENIERILIEELKRAEDISEALTQCYKKLDEAFLAEPDRDTSGTTAVTALVQHSTGKLWVANAGDSRCVLSSHDEAVAMSIDHKPERPDENDRIRKAGGFVIHNRVMGGLGVSRAIGDCDFKADGLVLVIPEPEIKEHKISCEDAYLLLACDGLFDVMQNDAAIRFIKREFRNGKNSTQAATAIGSHAVKNLHSQDNVSVLIVRFEHAGEDRGSATGASPRASTTAAAAATGSSSSTGAASTGFSSASSSASSLFPSNVSSCSAPAVSFTSAQSTSQSSSTSLFASQPFAQGGSPLFGPSSQATSATQNAPTARASPEPIPVAGQGARPDPFTSRTMPTSCFAGVQTSNQTSKTQPPSSFAAVTQGSRPGSSSFSQNPNTRSSRTPSCGSQPAQTNSPPFGPQSGSAAQSTSPSSRTATYGSQPSAAFAAAHGSQPASAFPGHNGSGNGASTSHNTFGSQPASAFPGHNGSGNGASASYNHGSQPSAAAHNTFGQSPAPTFGAQPGSFPAHNGSGSCHHHSSSQPSVLSGFHSASSAPAVNPPYATHNVSASPNPSFHAPSASQPASFFTSCASGSSTSASSGGSRSPGSSPKLTSFSPTH